MSLVMLFFSLSLACSNVCSTTPIRTSICSISCFSLVRLWRIFTTGAATQNTLTSKTTAHVNKLHQQWLERGFVVVCAVYLHQTCCCLSLPFPVLLFLALRWSEVKINTLYECFLNNVWICEHSTAVYSIMRHIHFWRTTDSVICYCVETKRWLNHCNTNNTVWLYCCFQTHFSQNPGSLCDAATGLLIKLLYLRGKKHM